MPAINIDRVYSEQRPLFKRRYHGIEAVEVWGHMMVRAYADLVQSWEIGLKTINEMVLTADQEYVDVSKQILPNFGDLDNRASIYTVGTTPGSPGGDPSDGRTGSVWVNFHALGE